MSNLQFTGTIHLIGETKQITDTFSKREFVVTDGADQYPKFINFELIKDNVDLVNGLHFLFPDIPEISNGNRPIPVLPGLSRPSLVRSATAPPSSRILWPGIVQ